MSSGGHLAHKDQGEDLVDNGLRKAGGQGCPEHLPAVSNKAPPTAEDHPADQSPPLFTDLGPFRVRGVVRRRRGATGPPVRHGAGADCEGGRAS